MYSDLLKRWCDSEYSDVNANAVLRYVHKKSMFDDLVRSGIVIADDENHFCFRKDVPESVLFSISKITGEQYDAFIRWSVLSEDGEIIPLYATQTIFDSWRNFYASLETSSGLCLATGKNVPISTKHPSKIRHSGDKAKLISSNDSSGFTYRGRFEDSSQACGIGVIATQKAHNALKWLIGRQGYRCDDLCVVTWSSSGEKTLNPVDDCSELFELDAPTIFTGEEASTHLNNRLRGYCSTILDKNVYVMMLDSATEGRLSILMYREYLGEELIFNMERWHKSLAWNHDYKFINKDGEWKRIRFVGAPTPRDIIDVAYGDNSDSSLVTHTVKTLMHCIVDGLSIPSALIDSAIRHASNPNSGIVGNHEKAVSVACSLFKHQNKGGYELTLEEDRRSRDYLYGRLLAVADLLESEALRKANESRQTTAMRMMQRFSEYPFQTWKEIEHSLVPYRARLGSRSIYYDKLFGEIMDLFNTDDFSNPSKLSGEYLLGYHCQKQKHFNAYKQEEE